MAFRIPTPGSIAASFGATVPAAAADARIGTGRSAGGGAGAGVGDSSHAATGHIPPDPMLDLDADVGVRVDALINLMASIWQPAPLIAVVAADPERSGNRAWLDASQFAQADTGATTSSRFQVLRAAIAACTRLSSWPIRRDDRPGGGAGPCGMANGFSVALTD